MLTLSAKIRKITGAKVEDLRKKDLIPAVIYGHQSESQSLELDYAPFKKVYDEAGESSLISLEIDGQKPIKALIHDIQLDPISGRLRHVDFYQIKEGEKITAEIELEFIGEAPVVKDMGGVLVRHMDSLEVKCLPENLVSKIEVDISGLKTFDDLIHVGDLKISKDWEISSHSDEAVVTVSAPKVEKEEKPAEAAAAPEVAGEVKKEGEEPKPEK